MKVVEATSDEVAEILGVTLRRVQSLAQEGVIPKIAHKRGKYDLVGAAKAYICYFREKAEQKSGAKELESLKAQKLKAEIRLKDSQGELHELRTDIAQGKYISTEDVKLDYEKFFVVFKKFAQAIPARVVGNISGYVDPIIARSIEKELKADIDETLTQFSVAAREVKKYEQRKEKNSG